MGVRLIEVKEDILSDNNKMADEVRQRLQKTNSMLLNLMSSPGSGKTSLILRTAAGLKGSIRMGVIEADIESAVDAEKVASRVSRPSNYGRGASATSMRRWSPRGSMQWPSLN